MSEACEWVRVQHVRNRRQLHRLLTTLSGEALLGCLTRSCAVETLTQGEWSELVDAAIRHGVGPILYRQLSNVADHVPALALARLHDVYLHNALRNVAVFDQLTEVLAALCGEAIPVIVLKGAHLASRVYGDPALRPMADIDLLVPPDDVARFEKKLIEMRYYAIDTPSGGAAYETHHHTRPFVKTGALPIEVHRSIVPVDSPFRVDLEGMWARARPVRIAGIDVLELSPADLIYHLCLHASYNHRFEIPLLAICDIGAAIEHYRQEIDWPRFAAVANAEGTSRFVYAALLLVQSSLRIEMAPGALGRLEHEDADNAVANAARTCILKRGIDLPAAYQAMGSHEGIRPKARLFLRSIYPSRERLRAIYDLPSHSRAVYWYYMIRPIDLLRRRGKLTVDMLLRTKRLRPALDRMEKRRMIDRWIDEVSRR